MRCVNEEDKWTKYQTLRHTIGSFMSQKGLHQDVVYIKKMRGANTDL